jgi:uncharacterized protein YgiM (DUF1202 family)
MRDTAGAHRRARYWVAFFALLLASCNSTTPTQPAVGAAFAGPRSLNLRKDLGPKAPTVASLKHGERVEILETRRRFVKVRTAEGIEGWTDQNLLLSQTQIEGLQRMADYAKSFPSQGAATVFDTLNLHVDPNRQSPSFYQITEGMSVDVIGHQVTPHHETAAPPAVPRRVAAVRRKNPKEKKSSSFDLPKPQPPKPPANWKELSRPHASDINAPKPAGQVQAEAPSDDWSLVRLKDGKVGWVLARMLNMSLPDEVAQYAEGRRITAYLPLGEVKDNGTTKHNWLWTTQSVPLRSYEFDSFRVFVWSIQRHRYETALIERNVKGFYPIEGRDGTFSVVLEDKDGKIYRRTYGFSGYHVRMVSKTPYDLPPKLPDLRTVAMEPAESVEVAPAGWRDKVKDWWTRVRGK